MPKKILVVLGMLFSFLILSTSPEAFSGSFEQFDYEMDRFFESGPVLAGMDGDDAFIKVKTISPAPPMKVIFGLMADGPDFTRPMFRRTGSENVEGKSPKSTEHVLKINLKSLEEGWIGKYFRENRGGIVPYRIEAIDPVETRMRYIGGLFAFRSRDIIHEGGAVKEYYIVPAICDGPFICNVTPTSVVFFWETDIPTSGEVVLEGPGFFGKNIVSSADVKTRHTVKIENLKPDTNYFYYVQPGSSAFPSRKVPFRTAPPAGSRRPFRFAFMSDCRSGHGSGYQDYNGVNAETLSQVFSMTSLSGAEMVIFGGDLVNGYTSSREHIESELKSWKEVAVGLGKRIPIFSTVGNHESNGVHYKIPDPRKPGKFIAAFTDQVDPFSMEAVFSRQFANPAGSFYGIGKPEPEIRSDIRNPRFREGPGYAETVYSFNWANMHFTVLNTNYWTTAVRDGPEWNSSSFADWEGNFEALRVLGGNREGYIMPNQMAWLEADLRAAQADPDIDGIFIVGHEPPFPVGGHKMDAMCWIDKHSKNDQPLEKPERPL